MRNFLEAIRTRGRPVADIEEGHISTATCILANLSQRLGRTLHLGRRTPARRGRRRSQPLAEPALSATLDAPARLKPKNHSHGWNTDTHG